jgi:hypothetical protein
METSTYPLSFKANQAELPMLRSVSSQFKAFSKVGPDTFPRCDWIFSILKNSLVYIMEILLRLLLTKTVSKYKLLNRSNCKTAFSI